MILKFQIQSFGARTCTARASKFSISKKIQGAKYLYFLVEIGMKLPFTLKNTHRIFFLKFEFLKLLFWTPEKVWFWFLKKNPQTFYLCVLALIYLLKQ